MQAGTSVHGQKNRHCSYLQDIQGAAWVLQPSQQPPKLSVLSIRKLFSYPPSNLQQAVSYSAFLPAGSEFRVMITCKYIPEFPLCQLHSASDSLQHLSQTFRNSSCLLCIAYLFRQ